MDYLVSTNRNKLTKQAKKKMSVSREDILWDEEMAAEELEGLSEDKLGKLENMARDNEEMED